MTKARDLFLLSALAYRQGKFVDSATLFATAMSSEDVDQFLTVLNEENTVTTMSLSTSIRSIEDSLEEAVTDFTKGLAASTEDEDTLEEENPSQVEGLDDEDFDDVVSDDVSTIPGQKILPSSLSTITNQTDTTSRLILSPSLRSPIKVKE